MCGVLLNCSRCLLFLLIDLCVCSDLIVKLYIVFALLLSWGVLMLRICNVLDVPLGQSLGFRLFNQMHDDFFLVNHHGVLLGYKNSCPHWPGATLPLRKNKYLDGDGGYIVCHGHGALFSIDTGLCVSGPCKGAYLDSVALLFDDAGGVYIKDVAGLRSAI